MASALEVTTTFPTFTGRFTFSSEVPKDLEFVMAFTIGFPQASSFSNLVFCSRGMHVSRAGRLSPPRAMAVYRYPSGVSLGSLIHPLTPSRIIRSRVLMVLRWAQPITNEPWDEERFKDDEALVRLEGGRSQF